jgi:hypothetical protein
MDIAIDLQWLVDHPAQRLQSKFSVSGSTPPP